MSDQNTRFGAVDGVDVHEITLGSTAGAEVRILTWGAVVRDIVVPTPNGPRHVCLGLNSIEDYQAHSPYFGAVPGRFANRIAHGRFNLDGKSYDLPVNNGGNTLHGGPNGFGTKVWTVTAQSSTSVTLTLHSPEGDMGFPGALEATCTYTLLEPATLRFELSATTDAPTVVNLTNHAYFNLDGAGDILDHELVLLAAHVTATDSTLIPTGELKPVAGTPFDFRTARPVRNDAGQTYDINYVLAGQAGPDGLRHAATLKSAKSGVTLDVYTDQPGVQLYDSATLDCPVPGLEGVHYGAHAGLCLETQNFPDAPNQPSFPSSVLRPGERYGNKTEFRFS